MQYTRKVRFEYYNIIIRGNDEDPNSQDTPFDLLRWISKVQPLSLEDRVRDYHQESARLDREWVRDDDYYYLNFVRLRETNIPSRATTTTEAEPLELDDDEFLGEDVTALYDREHNILMLQRNKYSLGVSGIEEYINLLWEVDNERIILRPIKLDNVEKKIKEAELYRKLNIRFADIPNHEFVGNTDSPIRKMIDTFGVYNAINAQIIITVGRSSGSTLHSETVHESFNDIYKNKGLISKAEVSAKETDDTKVEVIDLFEDKAHSFGFFKLESKQTLGYELVAAKMSEIYAEKVGELLSNNIHS